MEKVSVIVPTHNRPHFLARCIDSLLAQSYPLVEVVVVDDNEPGSEAREKTAAVLEEYNGNSAVTVVLNPHPLGGGPARNEGIKAASGDYVTFLDDDDIYLPEKVEKQLAFTLENELEMSFTDVYLHNEADKLVEFRRHSYVTDWSNEALMRQHILHSLGPTSTYMVKRSVLLDAGGFIDVPMGQDFMLMWRMIDYGTKIGYLPGSYIVQYLHSGERISVGKSKIDGENNLYELKKTRFPDLTPAERRYVRFRHFAVLSVSSLRSGKKAASVCYGCRAFFSSPSYMLTEIKNFRSNKTKVIK